MLLVTVLVLYDTGSDFMCINRGIVGKSVYDPCISVLFIVVVIVLAVVRVITDGYICAGVGGRG